MKRNEFIDFCNLNENTWQKFIKKSNGLDKDWTRREKLARADLIIQQKRSSGETNNRAIVTAIVDSTGVNRTTACKWLKHWISHHEPDVKIDDFI